MLANILCGVIRRCWITLADTHSAAEERTLTIKLEVVVEAWLTNTCDEDGEAEAIAEATPGDHETNSNVVFGEGDHDGGCPSPLARRDIDVTKSVVSLPRNRA